MANSPFAFFRKNTGLMMVVLCALLMFAFVVADPLMQMAYTGDGDSVDRDKVAVSWDDGELTEGQLGSLVFRRQILATFQQMLLRTGYEAALLEGNPDPQPLVQPLNLPSTPDERVEQDVVLTKIYADAARDAGLVVSDEAIRSYLDELGFGKVSREQMRDLLASMAGPSGRKVTIDYVFDLLRDAMLARNYDKSYFYSAGTVMPEQKWRDWLRVNDRVIVEAAALRATDFLSQVPEPTDAELAEFYDEYKDDIPAPQRVGNIELPGPNPAFTTPRRVVLEYAKLDLSKVIDEVIGSVTEEEIAAYYEENKDRFVKEDNMVEDFFSDSNLESAPEEGGESDSAEGESGEGEAMESEEPAGEEPADEPAAEESTEAPAAGQSSSAGRRSPFRFAAYQPGEEASEETADETTETDSPADNLSPVESLFGPGAMQGGESGAGETEPGGETPVADDPEMSDAVSDDAQSEEPVEYKPLDEVRKDIRTMLAEAKAIKELPNRMSELVAPLKEAYDEYFIKTIDAKELAKDNPEAELPEPPAALQQLAQLAEEKGLEYAKTADLSIFEARESAIGQTRDFTRSMGSSATGVSEPMYLWGRVFGESGLELYEPAITYDVTFDRNRTAYPLNGYIVLKIADEPRTTPPLDEIRPDVVRAWKLSQASELALKRAEEIATEAQGEGLSLKDFLAGQPSIKVDETDAFSWFTALQPMPTIRRIPLRLSQPEPLESVGPEFMKEVFELKPNQIGAALNNDHSVAYVVRVVQHMQSRSELRQEFLALGPLYHQLYGFDQQYMQASTAARVRDLLGGPGEESKLDWKRDPDRVIETEG